MSISKKILGTLALVAGMVFLADTAVAQQDNLIDTIKKRGKILFVNPGSAGPRRFTLPVTVARLALRSGRCEANIVQLALSRQSRKRGLFT